MVNKMKPSGKNDPGAVADAIARNVRRYRAARGFSLDQLAARSGVSKGMVVQIERGGTNPSIGTLCRVAGALGVTMPRLVDVTETPTIRLVRVEEVAVLWHGHGGGTARLLVGLDEPDLVEMWEWQLAPGDAYHGEAHPTGSHELLYVLEGTLTLGVEQSSQAARAGETLLFRADRPHAYRNEGRAAVRFVMVVVEPKPAERALPGREAAKGRAVARPRKAAAR
jgi:transcriptional regulator with XRE-family HTH domain